MAEESSTMYLRHSVHPLPPSPLPLPLLLPLLIHGPVRSKQEAPNTS